VSGFSHDETPNNSFNTDRLFHYAPLPPVSFGIGASGMQVRKAPHDDPNAWIRLRHALWPDQEVGQPCLKLPVPQGDVLRKLADLLSALAGK
jgi:hypothetical protein